MTSCATRLELDVDAGIDGAALAEFTAEYGTRLPPVAVVIAAYNEEHGIGEVIDTIPTQAAGLQTATIVVVDGSADDTAAIARKQGALVADVPANRGQGAALRLGYAIARAGGARYIITTDADGQYDATDIDTVLAPIIAGTADFVSGSRILGHTETYDKVRRAGVHVFARLVTALTRHHVTDTSFGLRAMRADLTAHITLDQPQYQASELLISIIMNGYRATEVPATMHLRTAGTTTKKGPNLKYGYRYTKVVLTTWHREHRRRKVAARR